MITGVPPVTGKTPETARCSQSLPGQAVWCHYTADTELASGFRPVAQQATVVTLLVRARMGYAFFLSRSLVELGIAILVKWSLLFFFFLSHWARKVISLKTLASKGEVIRQLLVGLSSIRSLGSATDPAVSVGNTELTMQVLIKELKG